MPPRVPHLPLADYLMALQLMQDAIVAHGFPLYGVVYTRPASRAWWSWRIPPLRTNLTYRWDTFDRGGVLNARWRQEMKYTLCILNIPMPDALDFLFTRIEDDYVDEMLSQITYNERMAQSPFRTRLAIHRKQRHEYAPLELIQLWKKLPVDALVTLVGTFVTAQVTPKRGLKRRHGSK